MESRFENIETTHQIIKGAFCKQVLEITLKKHLFLKQALEFQVSCK
jgi:hypothetical protein